MSSSWRISRSGVEKMPRTSGRVVEKRMRQHGDALTPMSMPMVPASWSDPIPAESGLSALNLSSYTQPRRTSAGPVSCLESTSHGVRFDVRLVSLELVQTNRDSMFEPAERIRRVLLRPPQEWRPRDRCQARLIPLHGVWVHCIPDSLMHALHEL